MKWLIFTLVSSGLVLDVDRKSFKSYTVCEEYVASLKSERPKSCFTSTAKFKKVKQHGHPKQHRFISK